jgi:hypothetical protein
MMMIVIKYIDSDYYLDDFGYDHEDVDYNRNFVDNDEKKDGYCKLNIIIRVIYVIK